VSTSISLRTATDADAEKIAALVEVLGYSSSPRTIAERLNRLLSQGDYLITVAQSETGDICGWVQAYHSEALESGARVEILGLIIAESARRRGIGRLLVASVESWAKHMGVQAVVVRSNIKREESHVFYQALGYRPTKTQNVYRKQLD
jgi:GNAT superfamily N-acetyltransferase